MAGSTNFPGSIDDFGESSPAKTSQTDATGRTHSRRHDDIEAAMEAVQTYVKASAAGVSATVILQSVDPATRPSADPAVRVFFFTDTQPTAALDGDVWYDLAAGTITPI